MYISTIAPDFKADALMPDNTFGQISVSQFKEKKYVLLFFYPLDFTFVCPSEIIALSKRINDFKSRDTEIIGISTDSKFSHYAWTNTDIENGGVGKINFPLVSDLSKGISKDYNVLLNNSIAVRASFIIDKKGLIRHYSLNDLPLGRNVDEHLRIIDSLQHVEKYGEVCPAGWRKGDIAVKPTLQNIKSFLKNNYDKL
jgi:peroxiredoxin (alkyl hydroperoxide reductase subunit C)